jgi:hypothetical protein
LVPGGRGLRVTYDNKDQFFRALESYRLNEFREQCEAMRRGLATVVPYRLLPLLSPHELELLVCGRSAVDPDFLKSMTEYEDGVNESDPHVVLFWRMIREKFDDEQRAKWLMFCWGRSRLPTKLTDGVRFKIQSFHRGYGDLNKSLPVSHTYDPTCTDPPRTD